MAAHEGWVDKGLQAQRGHRREERDYERGNLRYQYKFGVNAYKQGQSAYQKGRRRIGYHGQHRDQDQLAGALKQLKPEWHSSAHKQLKPNKILIVPPVCRLERHQQEPARYALSISQDKKRSAACRGQIIYTFSKKRTCALKHKNAQRFW